MITRMERKIRRKKGQKKRWVVMKDDERKGKKGDL